MIKKGSRVRYKDAKKDKKKGVMTVLEIKSGYAFCAYLDFKRFGQKPELIPILELKLSLN